MSAALVFTPHERQPLQLLLLILTITEAFKSHTKTEATFDTARNAHSVNSLPAKATLQSLNRCKKCLLLLWVKAH